MSTQQNIPQRVRAMLAEQAGRPVEEVHDEEALSGMGLDSLDTVELSTEIEDQFKFTMTEAEEDAFWELKTVADVVNFVQKKVAA
jgi:acyl carrier protein